MTLQQSIQPFTTVTTAVGRHIIIIIVTITIVSVSLLLFIVDLSCILLGLKYHEGHMRNGINGMEYFKLGE